MSTREVTTRNLDSPVEYKTKLVP